MTTHPPKLVQRLKQTDSLPYISPITTTLAPAPKPITMNKTIRRLKEDSDRLPCESRPMIMEPEDEIARLKAMNDDLKTLNGDVTKLRAERDKYRIGLELIRRCTSDATAAGMAAEALQPK